MSYYVYILECADGSYYTGSTSDLERRLYEHQSGSDPSAYTFSRRPVHLVWNEETRSKDDAQRFEHQVKGWNRKKKEALIRRYWKAIHNIVKEERFRREAKKKSG
jgi:predicted GIY-YIG superfamily endonuclease